MNKYESFLERNTIKLYHAADEYYSLSERGLEYRDKASICVDLVIFILDTLNQFTNKNGVDQAKSQFISATRLVFPIKTYFTALDFAYSREEAIEILARLSRTGDDPEALTVKKFDFRKLMEACYFVRVNGYSNNSNLQNTLPSAYAKKMAKHLNLDQNDVNLINAFEENLSNIAVQLQKLINKDRNLVIESAPKHKIKNVEENLPRNHTIVCSKCTSKVRIQKETGKYRCPNCKSLLVYITDDCTMHYVAASELISVSPETEATPKNKAYQRPPIITPDNKRKPPKTDKRHEVSEKKHPSAQAKYEKPNEVIHKHPLPIYVLFLAAAFPYFLIVSQLGIFDFFGIRNLSGMQKLLCFFVTAGVSIFGGVISTDDKWNDDWRKVTANYTIQSGFIIFGLIFIFHLLGTLDEEIYWYD